MSLSAADSQRLFPRPFPPASAEAYRAAGYWIDENFAQFVGEACRTHAQRPAVVARQATGQWQRLTYGELGAYADAVARRILAAGGEPGDRALLQVPNLVEYLGACLGIFRAGLIPVFSLPPHGEADLHHFLSSSGARLALTVDSFAGTRYGNRLREVAQRLEHPCSVLVVPTPAEASDGAEGSSAGSAGDNATGLDQPLGGIARDPFDLAFLQLSGGTTGTPKLIPRTHADYLYSVRASADICGVTPDTRLLVALPAAHNFTMSSPGILAAIYRGATMILNPDPTPSSSFQLIEQERATMVSLVPPLALAWLAAARSTRFDLTSLEVMQVGGSKLVEEAARRIRPELGCQLQQVFGMAEGLVNYTRLDDPEELVITTQGRPISPDDELLLLDDAGAPVPEGEPGNLWTRGPYTIRGYANNASANSFSEDGYYCTGDIVRILPSGHLQVTGRAKDQINRAGEKIAPEDVENHLLAHPAINDAAVVGVPDEMLGERICAYLLAEDALSRAEVRAFLRGRGVADFALPDDVHCACSFPVTAVGKISRKELRRAVLHFLTEAAPDAENTPATTATESK